MASLPEAVSDTDSSAPTIDSTSNTDLCYLTTIPGEIRNHIYELAFTTTAHNGDEVDLLSCQPPSAALLIACRQVREEAAGLYELAYCRFASKHFVINNRRVLVKREQIDRLDDTLLRNISNLCLLTKHCWSDIQYVWIDGIWRTVESAAISPSPLRLAARTICAEFLDS